MKLGVTDILPGDFRTHDHGHMQTVRDLGLTGFGFHLPGELVPEITPAECDRYRQFIASEGLDLAQFAILYGECLFSADPGMIASVSAKIERATALAARLGAGAFLLRPGSANPDGPWTPHRDNHLPEQVDRLVATLRPLAATAEREGLTLALETHAVSIMDPPEKCRAIVEAVGSPRLQLIMDPVNHFQCLQQVYNSGDWVDHIFAEMGALAPIAHIKDLKVSNGLVLHIDQTLPGEGELDLARVLRRFHAFHPEGYGLIEHLGLNRIPAAIANVRRIAAANSVDIP